MVDLLKPESTGYAMARTNGEFGIMTPELRYKFRVANFDGEKIMTIETYSKEDNFTHSTWDSFEIPYSFDIFNGDINETFKELMELIKKHN